MNSKSVASGAAVSTLPDEGRPSEAADADELLERQIEAVMQLGLIADDPDEARAAFAVMSQLIAQRSPEQIARMERERGLR